jgi:hypothetical protein
VLRRPLVSAVVFLVWTALLLFWATAATVWVAHNTAIGPVLVRLGGTEHGSRHGIHLGDLVAAVVFYGGAIAVVATTASVQLARRRAWIREGRPTRPLGA